MNRVIEQVNVFHTYKGGFKRALEKLTPESIKVQIQSETSSLVFRFGDLNTYMTLLPDKWRFVVGTEKQPVNLLRQISNDSASALCTVMILKHLRTNHGYYLILLIS